MKTKHDFEWHRPYSAIPESIIIPAGAPVHKKDNTFFVDPSFFAFSSIERHDAIHYGCCVSPDNVEE